MLAPRILILAAHPDDETVGCAAAIGRARAAGTRLFVVTLTTGIPAAEALWPWRRGERPARWRRRAGEARRAQGILGLESVGQLLLPSRSLRRHLELAAGVVEDALTRSGAAMLWVPAYEGGHQDHDAANLLGALMRRRLPVWEYAEYNRAGGRVHSQEFPAGGPEVVTLVLDAEERRHKRALLGIYSSERGNLRHVECRQESFRPLPCHDYARPPHAGRLFYERFHWVPFNHPGVDRTTSREVSYDLCRALRDWPT